MIIVNVTIRIKPDAIDAFKAATIENARNSRLEPGIARFDFLQSRTEPTRFLLAEAYRDEKAMAAHKATPHYAKWQETVASLMAENRTREQFQNISPVDTDW